MGCGSSQDAGRPNFVGTFTDHQATDEKGMPSGQKGMSAQILPHADVKTLYEFGKQLGKGNFGTVHLVRDRRTGQHLACKTICKRKLATQDDYDDVRREIQIMRHLTGHANVVTLHASYQDAKDIHLIMEVCDGGELFDHILKAGHLSEFKAAEIMQKIVSVVHHCHTMNVVHRDLKPENFLLTKEGMLKATDFGLSRFWKVGQVFDELVGSPLYVAPEVLRQQYGKEADIWSCGVILYILLCGWPPFQGESTDQTFRVILSAPLDLKTGPWLTLSSPAKDLVRRMLTRDPTRRLTAEQVLNHPWMKEQGVASDEPFIPEVLTRMRQFSNMNVLKREALKVFARQLPAIELEGMREMFKEMDEDGSGTITVAELRDGLRKKGATVALSEVEKILGDIDLDGNHRLDYEEFLAATIHLHVLDREDIMLAAFQHFDKDNSGQITLQELREALVNETSEEVLQTILSQLDKNGDSMIDYKEFCEMMRNNGREQLREASRALRKHHARPAYQVSVSVLSDTSMKATAEQEED